MDIAALVAERTEEGSPQKSPLKSAPTSPGAKSSPGGSGEGDEGGEGEKATSELAASLSKLKAKWNGTEEGGEGEEANLFATFLSPSKKQGEDEEPLSPLHAARAAAAHLSMLEREVRTTQPCLAPLGACLALLL